MNRTEVQEYSPIDLMKVLQGHNRRRTNRNTYQIPNIVMLITAELISEEKNTPL